ncbi:MAG: ROK family protein [Mucilaginibacter sp.]|nr:ROK family protein [Mucilaginibacter sp.]
MESNGSLILVIDVREYGLVQIATIDLSGNVLQRECIKADGFQLSHHVRIIQCLTKMFSGHPGDLELDGIGICADTENKDAGRSLSIMSLVRRLTGFFGISCTIVSRIQAITIAEQWNGAGVNLNNFIVIGLDRSISGRIVMDNVIIGSDRIFARDLGKLVIALQKKGHCQLLLLRPGDGTNCHYNEETKSECQ